MSNALLVSGAESETGRPVAVMGPQVAYFMPQILVEMDLHGPDIDAQGAAFPGISPYVLLGRGQDYAWSATSAGQDIIDTFAEKLCEPDGSAPDVQSTHYLYKGECREMETLTRVNNITPNPGDPSPPETYTLQAQRTVHGIVSKRGTVDGQPVAFAKQRSTYFHEADSARAFSALNSPSKVQNAEDFQRVMHKINFTFNWFYADDRDIAYFNSGDNPVRAEGADPDLPNWGTGEYDWQGWETTSRLRRHALRGAPAGDQPGLHHLLEQQAGTGLRLRRRPVGIRAALPLAVTGRADRSASRRGQQDEPGRGHRSDGAGRHHRPARQAGAFADPAGGRALPATRSRRPGQHPAELARAGAHRADRDQNGQYEHAGAIQIMDAWWPKLLEAAFEPEMGADFFDAVHGVLAFDNEPNNHGDHLGSAYQDGWWGYVSKDLRRLLGQPASDGFSRTYCGAGSLTACRDALRQALSDALAVPATTLYDEDAGMAGVQRVDTCARPARAINGASTPCASGRSALSRSARSTGSTAPRSSRPSRSRATVPAGTRAPSARRRCGSRSFPPSRPAPPPTASTDRRSPPDPAAGPSCDPTT